MKLQILTIKFSNIVFPHPDIIGYYIVRAKRDSFNRTIEDKGYLHVSRKRGVAPDHKEGYLTNMWFNNLKYAWCHTQYAWLKTPKQLFLKDKVSGSKIKIEGIYHADNIIYQNSEVVQDALPGTSSNGYFFGLFPGDKDGMSWVCGIRYNQYKYSCVNNTRYYTNNITTPGDLTFPIQDNYTLPAGERIENLEDGDYTLVNLQLDNPTQVIRTDDNHSIPVDDSIEGRNDLYYVSVLTGIEDIHPNLDNIEYYHTDTTIRVTHTAIISKGDISISHLPLDHSTYYKSEQPRRWGETITNAVAAILATTGAILLTIFTAGVGTATIPLAIALATITLTGLTATSAVLLSQLIKDIDSGELMGYVEDTELAERTVNSVNENDDLLCYLAEYGDGLFVETTINVGLRLEIQHNEPSFFHKIELDALKTYYKNKYLFRDETRDDKAFSLKPLPSQNVYVANLDYSRLPEEKVFFPLYSYYDCKSKCLESWKNRGLWSERSFDEEKADSYRIFLPNNY